MKAIRLNKHLLFAIITVIFIFLSCKNQPINLSYIRSASWLYDVGFKMGEGDFVEFTDSAFYSISNDTIYRKGIPVCVVLSANEGVGDLMVKSFSGQIGRYIDTREFLK
jgi:hypothetical protein